MAVGYGVLRARLLGAAHDTAGRHTGTIYGEVRSIAGWCATGDAASTNRARAIYSNELWFLGRIIARLGGGGEWGKEKINHKPPHLLLI